jgi:hypothetical protein
LVVACAVLLGLVLLGYGVWFAAARHTRDVSYTVSGTIDGLALDLGDADVQVVGAGQRAPVSVQHVDHYRFNHEASVSRSVADGMFRVRSRCPHTVLHDCHVRYRVAVPDNLPLTIRTGGGDVVLRGYHGSARITTGDGDVDVTGFCGFLLQVRAEGDGDISAGADCSPAQMTLRSTTGRVRAQVPGGRYRVEAGTSRGRAVVGRGITQSTEAPFSLQAFSSTGAVLVERRP